MVKQHLPSIYNLINMQKYQGKKAGQQQQQKKTEMYKGKEDS